MWKQVNVVPNNISTNKCKAASSPVSKQAVSERTIHDSSWYVKYVIMQVDYIC